MTLLRLALAVMLSILLVHAIPDCACAQSPTGAAKALTGLSDSFEILVAKIQPAVVQVF
jgi:hypothetical protein